MGVGIPLALLLQCPFWGRILFCPSEIRIKKFTNVFRRMGKEEMGEKERGLEGVFLMVPVFMRASKFPLSCKTNVKTNKQKTQGKVSMSAKKYIKITI